MTLNYGELNLAARDTIARMGARATPQQYEMALNAVTAQAAQRRAAPTTLPQALKQLQEEITKLDRRLGPVHEASPPPPDATNPARGQIYVDAEEGLVRTRDRGFSGREPERVRTYALPNPTVTRVPQPQPDGRAKK